MAIEAAKNGRYMFQSWDPDDLIKGDWDKDGRKEHKKAAIC